MNKIVSTREPYFDNLKFVLIVFMVIGHFAFENRSNPFLNGLCNAIYSFHMPLFIFISGYFSKSIQSQRKTDITSLLWPYLIFEIIHYAFTRFTGLGKGHLQFTYPTYQNWYLLSLFTWRLIIPYFQFFNKRINLVLVVFMAIGAGFVQNFNEFLSLYRSIYLLPFFVIGYYFNDLNILLIRFRKYRFFLSGLFLVFFVILIGISVTNQKTGEFLSYAFIPNFGYSGNITDPLLRIFSLFFSGIMGFLFLFMIPNKTLIISQLGKNTMTVYLTHIFFIWGFNFFIGGTINAFTIVLAILFSISLAIVLSSKIAEQIFRVICNPNAVFKRKS